MYGLEMVGEAAEMSMYEAVASYTDYGPEAELELLGFPTADDMIEAAGGDVFTAENTFGFASGCMEDAADAAVYLAAGATALVALTLA